MQFDQISPYPISYDLSNCENEPINFIATVQPHACVLACAANGWTVTQASTNVDAILGISHVQLLGQPLPEVMPEDAMASILSAVAKGSGYLGANPVRVNLTINGQPNWLNCLVHQQEQVLILEFEPFDEDITSFPMQRAISEAMLRIQHSTHLEEVLQASAEEVKKLTGYDRVMLYRFDEAGHGTIVAEAKEAHLEPYLGQRYPASDIPPQARVLFMKNPARIITDLAATPAMLQPSVSPLTGQPLDLTDCVGRGVSPIHIEYLLNMGVRASMSIAIVFEEKLWGLIACHHYSPKFTGHFKRHTTWFLGQIISVQLGVQSMTAYRRSVMRASVVKSRLYDQMSVNWDMYEGLTAGKVNMLDLTQCCGAAIYHEGKLTLLGDTPPRPAIMELIQWMTANVNEMVYSTNELSKTYPPAVEWKDKGAGLLAVRLSNIFGDYLMWFREEQVRTVHWAGNPAKAVTKEDGKERLSPRKSFEKWSQLVEGTSQPWQAYELEAALSLRNDVKDFIFQKYREVKQINRELTEAYDDLETFSYSISHDLRAPLKIIEEFAKILTETQGELMGEEGQYLLSTIQDNAAKLNDLIIGLLAYAQAGKKNLVMIEVSLIEVVRQESKPMAEEAVRQGRNLQLHIHPDLPNVVADKPALTILVKNLVSNAFKYSAKSNPTIVEIGGSEANDGVMFYIRDNGIGFDMQYAERIFGVFNRLVYEDQFEGTGIGLAIVKRIVEKHGGTISVESAPGKGTTFFVTMPNLPTVPQEPLG